MSWSTSPREEKPETFLYGIYSKDTIDFEGSRVRVKAKSTDILIKRLDTDYLRKLYDNRDREKFPDIQSFIRDVTSEIVIYYVGKSDTCIVKPMVKVEFLGSDEEHLDW
ncbi:hypothetical protein [Sanguibacteroides justesenii]|uniref:Uncharacterized protein n=1 Tax=Sanguibacteroides justesenii TaxID=1547597 RepID=A0A0C3R2U8_9PORP|nr:hypothetical protein [Sanguibacteroides justesenii]KIO43330.1 hypothetical protein BA92_12775 [Sanguibacteroides justesenii]